MEQSVSFRRTAFSQVAVRNHFLFLLSISIAVVVVEFVVHFLGFEASQASQVSSMTIARVRTWLVEGERALLSAWISPE